MDSASASSRRGAAGHRRRTALTGRPDEARALLAELEARSAREWVSPVGLARIHIGLGEHEAALAALERAYAERAYRLVELGLDDRWDPIRSEPRFRELVRNVGIRDSLGDAS